MGKLKSVTVDFEHKTIAYRPEGEPEQRIAVNQIYPDLFKAQVKTTELPAGVVDADIAKKEDNISKSQLTAEQKKSALDRLKSGESIEYIRRGLVVQSARAQARAQAESEVERLLNHYDKATKEIL